ARLRLSAEPLSLSLASCPADEDDGSYSDCASCPRPGRAGLRRADYFRLRQHRRALETRLLGLLYWNHAAQPPLVARESLGHRRPLLLSDGLFSVSARLLACSLLLSAPLPSRRPRQGYRPQMSQVPPRRQGTLQQSRPRAPDHPAQRQLLRARQS